MRAGDGAPSRTLAAARTTKAATVSRMKDAAGTRASRYAGANCLVTGGLGFIGSNLALTLAEADAKVTIVDSLEPRHGGDRGNVEGAPVEAPSPRRSSARTTSSTSPVRSPTSTR
jgi:nucleoside-diphosphate-sugar epimerase